MLTGFIETSEGVYPLSSITYVGPEKIEGNLRSRSVAVIDSSGSKRRVEAHSFEVDEMMRRPSQLIPAEPGSKLIYTGCDQDGAYTMRMPLIAWAMCLDGRLRPVTPAGVNDCPDTAEPRYGWYVEIPGGGIYGMNEGDAFESESELKLKLSSWYAASQAATDGASL